MAAQESRGSALACLYNVTCLGTTAFISDFSVFEKECIKNKPSKYRGSLVSSEMGELGKKGVKEKKKMRQKPLQESRQVFVLLAVN